MLFKEKLEAFSFLNKKQRDSLSCFYSSLCRFKSIFITKKNPENEIQKLIEDALLSGEVFLNKTKFKNIVDVGSGAGFPGMVWALFFPSRFKFILLEPSQKKSQFLNYLVQKFSLEKKVKIEPQPLFKMKEKVFLFQAFGPLRKTLKTAGKNVSKGAFTYHFKTEKVFSEWEALSRKERASWSFKKWGEYSFFGRKRHIIELQRVK